MHLGNLKTSAKKGFTAEPKAFKLGHVVNLSAKTVLEGRGPERKFPPAFYFIQRTTVAKISNAV